MIKLNVWDFFCHFGLPYSFAILIYHILLPFWFTITRSPCFYSVVFTSHIKHSPCKWTLSTLKWLHCVREWIYKHWSLRAGSKDKRQKVTWGLIHILLLLVSKSDRWWRGSNTVKNRNIFSGECNYIEIMSSTEVTYLAQRGTLWVHWTHPSHDT